MKQSFSKDERLCSRRVIRSLFASGNTFYIRPFRATWMRLSGESASPVQVLMSVPKYNFHKAVQRNLVRRRMKEAYRLNKQAIYPALAEKGYHLALSITYTSKEIVDYEAIQAKIILLLQRLTEENEKVTG